MGNASYEQFNRPPLQAIRKVGSHHGDHRGSLCGSSLRQPASGKHGPSLQLQVASPLSLVLSPTTAEKFKWPPSAEVEWSDLRWCNPSLRSHFISLSFISMRVESVYQKENIQCLNLIPVCVIWPQAFCYLSAIETNVYMSAISL